MSCSFAVGSLVRFIEGGAETAFFEGFWPELELCSRALSLRESVLNQLRSLLLDPELSQGEREIIFRLERENSVIMSIVHAATVDFWPAELSSTWSLTPDLFRATADQILEPLFRIQVPQQYLPLDVTSELYINSIQRDAPGPMRMSFCSTSLPLDST